MKKIHWVMLLSAGILCSCNQKQVFKSYEEYPVYEGSDLEMNYSGHTTSFRVWAPTADEVKVLLYDNGSEGGAYQTHDMSSSEKGTWTLTIDEDLKGKFYTYQIKQGEKWVEETPGAWVKATGLNGKRGAIIDMGETNPVGWESDERPPLKNFTDIVLYEVHMRDFSMSANSGMKNKGKFLAFTEYGTKTADGEKTGLDHLKELGVTHVHLLPSFDFASIDEARPQDKKYNWGYDPLNYNVPEGSYSTKPADPLSRIREFKQMVQTLHKNGIRVVMDVVYNHTSTGKGSHLDLLVPGYFYRHNADSTLSNASGCGNETASERAMMRKLMIESVVYWATEYHVDGFRFDLMGIHDIETMNEIRAALDEVDPTIFIYGEGWTADKSPLAESKRAVKKNVKELKGIAVFSDDLRDAIKGSWMHAEVPGFVAGTDSLEESIKFGVVASTKHDSIDYTKPIYSKAPYATSPSQIINYVSCHDDLCLVDKLKESRPANASDEDLKKFNKLAQTIVFTSQGVPFIYAGEELYRNKKGVHNTYNASDSINQIDWSFKTTHKDVFDYYKGLIALRKAHPAFRIPTLDLVQKHLQFLSFKHPNVVGFVLKDHVNGDSWSNILVLYNGYRYPVTVTIPEGNWNVICHDGQINLNGISTAGYGSFTIAGSSASIMYQE